MKRLPLMIPVLALASCNGADVPQTPNVIFILADDLGYGDITPYGQQFIETPNLERLAAQGLLMTDCYAGCTVSAPSRASLMTGLHTGHTFVRGNKELMPEGQLPMPEDTKTIGDLFQSAGYTTGIFGKWGLGAPGMGAEPLDMGFDSFYGYNCQRKAHTYYPDYLYDGRVRDTLSGNIGGAKEDYAAELIHKRGKDFIRENAGKPFFAMLTYTLPHAELIHPYDSLWQYYREKFKDIPEDYKKWNTDGDYCTVEHPLTAFASMVSQLDIYVGEVMDLVEDLGIADNTVIIFSSDNGPHNEGGANPEFFDSNSIYRGTKRDLYEGGIRVPFIVSCPSFIKPGSKSSHPCAFWDLAPTFAQLAGVNINGNTDASVQFETDGLSLVDLWSGKKARQHDYFYWEFHEQGGRQAVRMGDWKGIRQQAKSDSPTFELYNLADDPSETRDLASEYPDIVRKIEEIMAEAHTPSDIFPFK